MTPPQWEAGQQLERVGGSPAAPTALGGGYSKACLRPRSRVLPDKELRNTHVPPITTNAKVGDFLDGGYIPEFAIALLKVNLNVPRDPGKMEGRRVEDLCMEAKGMQAHDNAPNADSATKGDVKELPPWQMQPLGILNPKYGGQRIPMREK